MFVFAKVIKDLLEKHNGQQDLTFIRTKKESLHTEGLEILLDNKTILTISNTPKKM